MLPGKLDAFRVSIRPTALLYSALKERKDRGGGTPGMRSLACRKMADLTQDEIAQLNRSRRAITKLRNMGATIVLLRIPCGEAEGPAGQREPDFFSEFAAELNAPEIDLPKLMRTKGIALRYSDGLHMVGSTALAASEVLGDELAVLFSVQGDKAPRAR